MPFKPTKQQILQAWDDLDAGKPIAKEMRVYFEELEELERENAAAAKDTSEWAKRQVAPWQVIGAERVGGVRQLLVGSADFCPPAATVIYRGNDDKMGLH